MQPSASGPLLVVRGLSRAFGGLQAVSRLDLEAGAGEIVGLIGPNGSGKTTLFNLISGYLRPDAGTVRLGREELVGLGPPQICRRGIARTFQLVRPFPNLTVLRNVMVGRLYGSAPITDQARAREESLTLLQLVGLEGKEGLPAARLTLVERKRLELARALATRPKVLLLDELMAGLNAVETQAAMELIRSIGGMGITVILVEHIIQAVIGLCHRVVVVNAGEKIADGPPRAILQHPTVIEAYLGRRGEGGRRGDV